MKDLYKKQITQTAETMAEALAMGEDIAITTTKSGQLKIKVLEVRTIKPQEQTQAGEK